jgi:hypothetical protein
LARLIRCAIVASGTRNAAAISAVVRPPTARRVSASWEGADSAGWQQSASRVIVSSSAGVSAGGASCSAATASRRRRALSLRQPSVSRRVATVSSQPRGLPGGSPGQTVAASSSAS